MKPDTSICSNEKDFYDNDGNYLKTACQASYSRSQGEACVDRGMKLFSIDSLATEREILSFAASIFGTGQSSSLWIDGKKESDGNWYTYNPERQRMVSGINCVTDENCSEEDSDEDPVFYEVGSTAKPKRISVNHVYGHIPTALKPLSNRNRFERFRRSQPIYSRPLHKRFTKFNHDRNCLALFAFGKFKVEPWSCYSRMYSFCEYTKHQVAPRKSTTTTEAPSTTTPREITLSDEDYVDYVERMSENEVRFGRLKFILKVT